MDLNNLLPAKKRAASAHAVAGKGVKLGKPKASCLQLYSAGLSISGLVKRLPGPAKGLSSHEQMEKKKWAEGEETKPPTEEFSPLGLCLLQHFASGMSASWLAPCVNVTFHHSYLLATDCLSGALTPKFGIGCCQEWHCSH